MTPCRAGRWEVEPLLSGLFILGRCGCTEERHTFTEYFSGSISSLSINQQYPSSAQLSQINEETSLNCPGASQSLLGLLRFGRPWVTSIACVKPEHSISSVLEPQMPTAHLSWDRSLSLSQVGKIFCQVPAQCLSPSLAFTALEGSAECIAF